MYLKSPPTRASTDTSTVSDGDRLSSGTLILSPYSSQFISEVCLLELRTTSSLLFETHSDLPNYL